MASLRTHRRVFGQWEVTVAPTGVIWIVGNWFSNGGVFYPHMSRSYQDAENVLTFGVDNYNVITKASRKRLENLVKTGKLDHLIEA